MGVDPVVSELLGTLLERYCGALTAIG